MDLIRAGRLRLRLLHFGLFGLLIGLQRRDLIKAGSGSDFFFIFFFGG